jgi:hypothetical protein
MILMQLSGKGFKFLVPNQSQFHSYHPWLSKIPSILELEIREHWCGEGLTELLCDHNHMKKLKSFDLHYPNSILSTIRVMKINSSISSKSESTFMLNQSHRSLKTQSHPNIKQLLWLRTIKQSIGSLQ